jgi:hypothetical protein
MTSVSPAGGVRATILVDEDRRTLLDLLHQDGLGTVYLRSLVHEFGITPTDAIGHGRFYGFWRGPRLSAVVFVGNARNMTTLGPDEDLEVLLGRVQQAPERPRLFVGPEVHAPAVRRPMFRGGGVRPRLDRKQAYYVLDRAAVGDPEPLDLRPARESERDQVVRAHAAMIEEDLGIPVTHLDVDRLGDLANRRIRAGKIWVHMRNGELVFKTEEIGRAPDAVLVGGVYTAPIHRGRGYASRGMASWARDHFPDEVRHFALHVNAVNTPAYRAYERAGYRRRSTLRLILSY